MQNDRTLRFGACYRPLTMMRNSALLKWAHNANNNKQTTKEGNRTWIHPPDALQRGHIAYLVKFLGNTEVDQPKGITVVKESIRKLQFNQQLRKAEGNKTPKVELTISIDGVAIQEPKTKRIMHQYPLHRISYCADDKGEKKFFSFIAKEADSENHNCFVFVSDKLSEEITLTIGQAFDLAYRRFLETSGKDLELQRRFVLLTQKASRLENEVAVLRQRLSDVSKIKGQSDVEEYMAKNGIVDLLIVDQPTISSSAETSPSFNQSDSSSSDQLSSPQNLQNRENGNLLNFNSSSNSSNGMNSPPLTQSPTSVQPPPVPPRAFEASNSKPFGEFTSDLPTVGRKLEGLLFEELEDDFNPRAYEQSTNGSQFHPPLLAPPPKASRDASRRLSAQNNGSLDTFKEDLFGSTPFNPEVSINNTQSTNIQSSSVTTDPFGMGDFSVGDNTNPSQQELESAIGFIDKRLLEMKDGFSRGLSFGNDDFSLESLDPLRH